ncbi:MAG: Fur family transcriptional regulator [Alphaproteobacteria bacterium]|jgi:Fur family zinc uptake transcriptional regulator
MAKAAGSPLTKPGFAPAGHDHRACVDDALSAADDLCAARGARLTPLRRRVLELVWDSHKPVGAYAILEALEADRRAGTDGDAAGRGPVAPPTVYRALDFLLENRLIHRIEMLNAYIGCSHPEDGHSGQFLLCGGCGAAAELDSDALLGAIGDEAAKRRFAVRRVTVEVEGLCPDCRGKSAPAG